MFNLKPTKLGIFQRGGHYGKGHQFMLELADKLPQQLKEHFRFGFYGNNWEEVVKKFKSVGIDAWQLTDDFLEYPLEYEHMYFECDYLLVPSIYEGAPMCLQEAHLMGIPIISSRVGQAGYEIFPDYVYPPGDHKYLMQILKKIYDKKNVRRQQILHKIGTWEQYTARVLDFIRET